MPQKSLTQRRKRGGAEGIPTALKRSDTSGSTRSAHGEKKSSRVVARAATANRNVSRKRPPGEGKTKRPGGGPLDAMSRTAARRRGSTRPR